MMVTFFILSFVIVLCLAQTKQMSFFVTSKPYAGGNLGGLAGADAKCTALATAVGEHTGRTWKAYLSSSKEDARDRIGSGPWYNQKLVEIASNINNLHSNNGMNQQLGKANTLDEKGNRLNGKGDSPNRHDVLTGSTQAGRKIEDLNCKDWTSTGNGGANRAQVGHHDKDGGGANPTSWNSAHPSRGCTIDQLRASGGDGRFYCFAIPTAAPTTTTPKPTTTTAKPTTTTTAKAPAPTQTPKNTPPPTTTAAGTCNAGSCADCINSSTGSDRCKWCPVDGKGCMAYTDACGGSIRSADQCSAAPTTPAATPPIDDPNNCGAQTANGCTACVQAAGGEDSEDDNNRCKWCPVGTPACIPYGAQCGGSQRTKAQCEAAGAPPSTSGSSARCGDASLHLNKCSACLVIDGSEPGSLCNWCHGTKTCAAKGDPNCIRPLASFIECGSVTDAPRIATAAPTPLGGLTDSVNSDASRVFGLTCIASLCLLLSLLF